MNRLFNLFINVLRGYIYFSRTTLSTRKGLFRKDLKIPGLAPLHQCFFYSGSHLLLAVRIEQ
ncbi:MAG TPA: hypothetical protein PLO70_12135, partial [Chitinophagaceae bacterium]|nr:hypothetical protein [Chitinophagaceae bacterium]HQZ75261.1 hypothetical protein [Chitinophagaceae bacterium]